ncbi:MAG: acyloxyacyl hydrolase [Candidatus Sulfotelmatobacter sp.]
MPVRKFTLFLLFASSLAFAQDDLPAARQKGGLDLSVLASAETGEELTNSLTEAQIFSAGASAGWEITGEHGSSWRRGSLEYAFDFVPVFETFGNQRTHGIGFDPVILRWNSVLHWSRISPYIDLAGGGVSTPVNLPPGNTSSFNFMAKGGGGIYLRTRNRQAFDVGFRWSHISNANLGIQNPEFNGVQLSLAYHWFK